MSIPGPVARVLHTCEIHNLPGHFDALPDGKVGAHPREHEGTEQRPHHATHIVHTVGDLQHTPTV